jgi:hypothetical protein
MSEQKKRLCSKVAIGAECQVGLWALLLWALSVCLSEGLTSSPFLSAHTLVWVSALRCSSVKSAVTCTQWKSTWPANLQVGRREFRVCMLVRFARLRVVFPLTCVGVRVVCVGLR